MLFELFSLLVFTLEINFDLILASKERFGRTKDSGWKCRSNKNKTVIPKHGTPFIVAELKDWKTNSTVMIVMKEKNQLRGTK